MIHIRCVSALPNAQENFPLQTAAVVFLKIVFEAAKTLFFLHKPSLKCLEINPLTFLPTGLPFSVNDWHELIFKYFSFSLGWRELRCVFYTRCLVSSWDWTPVTCNGSWLDNTFIFCLLSFSLIHGSRTSQINQLYSDPVSVSASGNYMTIENLIFGFFQLCILKINHVYSMWCILCWWICLAILCLIFAFIFMS